MGINSGNIVRLLSSLDRQGWSQGPPDPFSIMSAQLRPQNRHCGALFRPRGRSCNYQIGAPKDALASEANKDQFPEFRRLRLPPPYCGVDLSK